MNDFEETLRDRLATLAQEAVPEAEAHPDAELANVEWIEPRRRSRSNMARALLVAAAAVIVVASLAGVVAVRRDASPSAVTTPRTMTPATTTPTTTTPTITRALEPAEEAAPAAGACATAQNNVGVVTLGSPDNVPNPRCLILFGKQKLRVVNSASTPLTVTLGHHFHATIAPHGEHLFTDAVATYLAPGVHRLAPTGLPGAEIWIDPPCSQTPQGCATP